MAFKAMPIRVLSPDVSSKIAAGEIVERPASIVKEFIENSLDADASEVSIEVRAGGTEYIRVADNGTGIPADEVGLAFERFATSKLSTAADLAAISSLGFRGEALPSIAAVSTASLVTRLAEEDSGTRVDVADGELVEKRNEAAAPGTVVTVRHLFRSVPARRKFLASAATESSRVRTLATHYALAYPAVRFQLSLDGVTSFSSSGSGGLREVVSDVYGHETAHEMLETVADHSLGAGQGIVVTGMVGPPSMNRANRSRISIFVNGRWVQDRVLGYAIEDAYRGFLKERRFPVAVVHLGVPHEDVDVNVHPSKTEVRFRRSGQVFAALQQAVRDTLLTHSPVPEIGGISAPAHHASAPAGPRETTLHPGPPAPAAGDHGPSAVPERPWPPATEPLVPAKALPALRVLGQVQTTYIAAEGPDGVYLVDQHAAHERVLFERVRADALARPADVQSLLEPLTVELDPRQNELLDSHSELVARLGFRFESFGGRTYILRGVPSALSGSDPGRALVEVLDLMADGGGFETWEERGAYSVACHGAIRAGKTLSQQEMVELTRSLETCEQPHTCPHGRPTMIHLSSALLEREFGRR